MSDFSIADTRSNTRGNSDNLPTFAPPQPHISTGHGYCDCIRRNNECLVDTENGVRQNNRKVLSVLSDYMTISSNRPIILVVSLDLFWRLFLTKFNKIANPHVKLFGTNVVYTFWVRIRCNLLLSRLLSRLRPQMMLSPTLPSCLALLLMP